MVLERVCCATFCTNNESSTLFTTSGATLECWITHFNILCEKKLFWKVNTSDLPRLHLRIANCDLLLWVWIFILIKNIFFEKLCSFGLWIMWQLVLGCFYVTKYIQNGQKTKTMFRKVQKHASGVSFMMINIVLLDLFYFISIYFAQVLYFSSVSTKKLSLFYLIWHDNIYFPYSFQHNNVSIQFNFSSLVQLSNLST